MELQTYHPIKDEIFHVHTFRCGHAEEVPDRKYVEKAIELGAPRIVFTDHAPFPGNPFVNRMNIEDLPEYVEAMNELKAEFAGKIEILAGLEAEYLPGFHKYLCSLKKEYCLDILILGQHLFERESGRYSFADEDKSEEYVGLCDAMRDGIKTGIFDAVAHPDRAFRRRKTFGIEEAAKARELIGEAAFNGVYLEMNYSSMHTEHQLWPEFWELLPPQALMIYGLDAHSVEEMTAGYKEYQNNMSA